MQNWCKRLTEISSGPSFVIPSDARNLLLIARKTVIPSDARNLLLIGRKKQILRPESAASVVEGASE